MLIDLDKKFVYSKYSNQGGELEEIFFPMGELHYKLPQFHFPDTVADVFCRIRNSEDIMKLLLVCNILDNNDIYKEHLIIPYLPYARQDRITSDKEPYSIQVIANLIKGLGFRHVTVVDVHSNVPGILLPNLNNYIPFEECKKWLKKLDLNPEEITLICPDLGAVKRTELYMHEVGFKEIVYCMKKRDSETGKLSGFKVLEEINTDYALVVDDICDGGGTFLGLADKLKSAGATNLLLWVTHGGFTKGFNELFKWYDQIGCTTSYQILSPTILENKSIEQISIDYQNILV